MCRNDGGSGGNCFNVTQNSFVQSFLFASHLLHLTNGGLSRKRKRKERKLKERKEKERKGKEKLKIKKA